MRTRLLLATAFAVLSVGLIAGPAHAATQQKFGQKYQMNGKTKSGKTAKGTFTVNRFVKSKYTGRLVALGTWKGKVGGKRYTKRNVRAVAKLRKPAAGSQLLPPIPGACNVLNLVLGPINLNLLGLVVRTNQINVRIDAVPGPGNLLGNLLCGVVGILDPQMTNGQIARLLNGILTILQPVRG
jgi:hypothetical protein